MPIRPNFQIEIQVLVSPVTVKSGMNCTPLHTKLFKVLQAVTEFFLDIQVLRLL